MEFLGQSCIYVCLEVPYSCGGLLILSDVAFPFHVHSRKSDLSIYLFSSLIIKKGVYLFMGLIISGRLKYLGLILGCHSNIWASALFEDGDGLTSL